MGPVPEPAREETEQLPHAHSKKWVPYRNAAGEVVTITWDQVRAVLHAMRVVDDCRRTQERVFPGNPPHEQRCQLLKDDIPEKSRALGRLLIEGLPLFEEMPPFDLGAAAYWVWDEENDEAR